MKQSGELNAYANQTVYDPNTVTREQYYRNGGQQAKPRPGLRNPTAGKIEEAPTRPSNAEYQAEHRQRQRQKQARKQLGLEEPKARGPWPSDLHNA